MREDLRVSIKNIFENLRSCLDYLGQDLFETQCASSTKPRRLYFPIRATQAEFEQAVDHDYPGLRVNAPSVYAVIEGIQPYHDPWLGRFNRLNNHNKHENLSTQTRTEARQVNVSAGDGTVSWRPGVTFGPGVSIMGVPIDPRTQLPIPNTVLETKVVTWVDFRFEEIDQAVLPFLEESVSKVGAVFRELERVTKENGG